MVGQRWDLQAESWERGMRFVAWSRRKVIPRIEGSIRQARNVCGIGRAWGEKLWRRKQARGDKLGLDNPEVWR